MTIGTEESKWFGKRDELNEQQRQVVDLTIEGMVDNLKAAGLPAPGDDRMAKVEAALIRYMIETA
jgi:hypothetical protein